jgi:predicted HTH transcriptional regulator
LAKDNKQRDELCKDVTAFANSAGGQIVYGVEEDKNLPAKIDDGADPAITKEWIEQVIDSRVQPRIEGLVITPIKAYQRAWLRAYNPAGDITRASSGSR